MTNTPDDDDRGPSSVFDSDDVVFTDLVAAASWTCRVRSSSAVRGCCNA